MDGSKDKRLSRRSEAKTKDLAEDPIEFLI